MFQNRHILPGKVWKAVYVKGMFFRKGTIFQLLQKPGHLISRIPFSSGAHGVIALHDQGELFQFLGEATLHSEGCLGKILGRDTAAFKFVYGIHEAA